MGTKVSIWGLRALTTKTGRRFPRLAAQLGLFESITQVGQKIHLQTPVESFGLRDKDSLDFKS